MTNFGVGVLIVEGLGILIVWSVGANILSWYVLLVDGLCSAIYQSDLKTHTTINKRIESMMVRFGGLLLDSE